MHDFLCVMYLFAEIRLWGVLGYCTKVFLDYLFIFFIQYQGLVDELSCLLVWLTFQLFPKGLAILGARVYYVFSTTTVSKVSEFRYGLS